jgi:hypothetical protein
MGLIFLIVASLVVAVDGVKAIAADRSYKIAIIRN